MSIFNKVRQFPEYFDMNDAFDKVRRDEVQMVEGYSKGFGPDFDVFFKKQPTDLHEPFDIIYKNGLEIVKSCREDFMKKTDQQAQFATLKAKQEHLLADFNNMTAREEDAKKAREVATKEEAKLATVQSKGNQADITKQERISQSARTKAESLTELAEKTHADFDKSKEKHTVDFVLDWINQISIILHSEKESTSKLINIGEAFVEASSKFQGVNDSSLPKLKDRLRQWEEYPAD